MFKFKISLLHTTGKKFIQQFFYNHCLNSVIWSIFLFRLPVTYSAQFQAGSDPDFSVTPQTGELLPEASGGTLIKVMFKPTKYGRLAQGRLIIQVIRYFLKGHSAKGRNFQNCVHNQYKMYASSQYKMHAYSQYKMYAYSHY